jgi:hypothetical protein
MSLEASVRWTNSGNCLFESPTSFGSGDRGGKMEGRTQKKVVKTFRISAFAGMRPVGPGSLRAASRLQAEVGGSVQASSGVKAHQ